MKFRSKKKLTPRQTAELEAFCQARVDASKKKHQEPLTERVPEDVERLKQVIAVRNAMAAMTASNVIDRRVPKDTGQFSRRAFVAGMGALVAINLGWQSVRPDMAFAPPANAWSHGQLVSGTPPGPMWPTPNPSGANYYLSDSLGNDSNSGLSTSAPWKTIAHMQSALASATGTVTCNFLSTDTFATPNTGSSNITKPSGVTNFTLQGLIGSTLPIITANVSGSSGAFKGANTTISGLAFRGDNFSYGIVADANTTITHCDVRGFPITGNPGAWGICIVMNAANVNINNNIIGGLAVNDFTGVGIDCQIIAGGSIKNNEILYCGGLNTNSFAANTQTGFGIHTEDTSVTYGVPFTFTSGVPTNFLLEIAYNVVHDCSYNVISGSPGGPSGIELGGGNLQWCHDNIVYNILPNLLTFMGGTDFDSIDCGDTNCGTTLVERNICYNCLGGFIDFGGDASIVGPIIARYNLVVNNGIAPNIGNAVIQGEGQSGIHHWYCNTFVVMLPVYSGFGLTSLKGTSVTSGGCPGFLANNLTFVSYIWSQFATSGISNLFTIQNNGWSKTAGAPEYYDFSFGVSYSSYAAAKAGQALFDQHGIVGDPLFAQGITALSWSSGTTSVTTAVAHGLTTSSTVTIDGTAWYDSGTNTGTNNTNGTFMVTVTGANTFTYPQASDPRGAGSQTLTSGGIWASGSTSALLNPPSYKLGSVSSPYYRTGLNLVTAFGISASEINGSMDMFGNVVNATTMSVGFHQP